jgi:hypothetical protein
MFGRIGLFHAWPFAVGVAVLAATLAVPAQTQTPTPVAPVNPQRVPITTADGVELDGTYYSSQSGKPGRDTPCVIMVNKYGVDRTKTDWITLAAILQNSGFAVLTFDLRGHGNSTQLSNPDAFWRVAANRNGIRGGTSATKKSVIDYKEFKPSYFPFLVNDVAAARRFFEQKNDAGEVNIHSLFVLGAQEGASLGFLFTAAEYNRVYRVGVTALQSNGTAYNAGEDIAAGVWLSLVTRPTVQGGSSPNFNMANWSRSHPLMRDKTPMCFVFGEKDSRSKNDADIVFKALTNPMAGRPDKNKLDKLQPIRGTDLSGPALLQPALNVPQDVLTFCQKVLVERRAVPWSEVKPEANFLQLIPLGPFGL